MGITPTIALSLLATFLVCGQLFEPSPSLPLTTKPSPKAQQSVDKGSTTAAPKDAREWETEVAAQFQTGASEEALSIAENALRAIPEDPQLVVTLATICVFYGQTQAAQHFLEDALETSPENADLRILLARVSLLGGQPQEALSVLHQLPTDNKRSEPLLLKGEAYALIGDLDSANTALRAALGISPNDVASLTTYAWVLQLQGRYRDALPMLSRAATIDAQSASIPYRTAVSYYFLASSTMAERFSRKALALDPQYAAAYFLLGMSDLREKDFNAATDNLRKAVELKPSVALFHRELGKVLSRGPNREQARIELDRAVTLDSEDAENYFWRGQLLLKQGAVQPALQDLKNAVIVDPHYLPAYTALAHLYSQLGQPREAAEVLAQQKQAHMTSKDSAEARVLLGSPETLR